LIGGLTGRAFLEAWDCQRGDQTAGEKVPLPLILTGGGCLRRLQFSGSGRIDGSSEQLDTDYFQQK
jgi:hypothetical protein